MHIRDVPVPDPKPGQVLVGVAYAGVNYTDIYRRNGDYATSPTYPTPLPARIGVDGAGTIVTVGDGVTGLKAGDRVAFTRIQGSYAEYAAVPQDVTMPVPEGMDLDTAAALITQGTTAHYLATSAWPLNAGETCLVHAGAGGVGQLLTQIARIRGARVLATVGSTDKAEIARACGADAAILYRETDFREAVMAATKGAGVDVVYDSVGRATFGKSIHCLRPRGLCVLYGHASGKIDNIDPLDLSEAGSIFFTRPHMAHYIRTREEFAGRWRDLTTWALDGRLKVAVDRVLPLADAAVAHRAMEARESRGKLLLSVAP
jgi:NADPH2:quinone reductase